MKTKTYVWVVKDANGDIDSCYTIEGEHDEHYERELSKRLSAVGHYLDIYRVRGNNSQLSQRVTTIESLVKSQG